MTTSTTTLTAHDEHRLVHFPVALFATVMGMAGLTLAWMKAPALIGVPEFVGEILRWMTSALFLFLLSTYGLKLLRHPGAVLAEQAHPVKQNFFPAISIGLLLLSSAWLTTAPGVARLAWVLATALHLWFTLKIMRGWLFHDQVNILHANPAWFIPVVGNILVPIAGARLAPADLNWFFFSVGLVFWLVLLTIILYRLFFHESLPARLMPTLFILIAPPAVGFIAYVSLTGMLDTFGRILYFVALFFTLLMATHARAFLRLPFSISAWAASFPMAAITIASLEMATFTGQAFFTGLGGALLMITSILILTLVIRTLAAARAGQICVPE